MTKKVAFITGGVGGIGSAIAAELSHKGYKVVAGYHPAEAAHAAATLEKWKSEGRDAAIIEGDVSSFDSCKAMAEKIRKEHGSVSVLVNCAGITRDKTLKKLDPKDWMDVINVNLNGMYNVTKQFVEPMTEQGFGRIINISSVNGKKGQLGQTNYSASKAGVHGFTMALAQEVARKGVTVNSISPGYIDTAMTKAIPQDAVTGILAQIPTGRMGKPEDIAYVAGFLADERAGYITGANISVNGGLFISF